MIKINLTQWKVDFLLWVSNGCPEEEGKELHRGQQFIRSVRSLRKLGLVDKCLLDQMLWQLTEAGVAMVALIKTWPITWSVKPAKLNIPKFIVIDLISGKEANERQIALDEDWAKGLIYCDMEGFAVEQDGTLILLDECNNYAYCPADRFEIRPTIT
jgi:hypothetical protein